MHQLLFHLGALVTTALPLPAEDLRLAQAETAQPSVVAAPPPEAAAVSAEGTESLSSFRAGDLIAAASNLSALPDGLSAGASKHAQGVIAYYRGDRSAAARLFNEAAGLDAAYAPPVAALIRLRLAEGDTSGARALFEQRLSASGNAASIEATGLLIDLAQGQSESVIGKARKLLLRDEKNLDAYFAMAAANVSMGRVEIARYICDQAISRDAGRPDFYFLKAKIELAAGSQNQARTFLRRVIELDPNHPEARTNLGVLSLRTRDFEGAIEHLEAASKVDQNSVVVWNNLGSAYKGAQRYDDAKTAFDKALALAPSESMSYYNLGLLYFDAEFAGLDKIARMDKAAELFNAFLAKSPSGPAVERATKFAKDATQLAKTERDLKTQAEEKKRLKALEPPAEETEAPTEEPPAEDTETPMEEPPAAEENAP
jgi:tetratricopeptide (TPR) repeat protein